MSSFSSLVAILAEKGIDRSMRILLREKFGVEFIREDSKIWVRTQNIFRFFSPFENRNFDVYLPI
jgi:hypothetical protein